MHEAIRRLLLCLGLVVVLPMPGAIAYEPIEDPETWESQFLACLQNVDADCLESLVVRHFPSDEDSVVTSIRDTFGGFASVFEDEGVFGVSTLIEENLDDKIRRRLWWIERNDGEHASIYLVMVRVQGGWYVKSFNFSTKEETLEGYLGFEI